MTTPNQKRELTTWVISLVAAGFGLLTIKEGGTVLFGDETARAAAGNYVPFVLWFNFLAGFAYVAAAAGLWLQKRWAVWLAGYIALATVVTFASLGIYIYSGGLYELRTVIAMSLRSVVWIVIAVVASKVLRRR